MPKLTVKELAERMDSLEAAVARIEAVLGSQDPAARPIPRMNKNQSFQDLDDAIESGRIFRDGGGDVVVVMDDDGEEVPQPTQEQLDRLGVKQRDLARMREQAPMLSKPQRRSISEAARQELTSFRSR